MAKSANVLYNDKLAGYISETDEGYVFQYAETYLDMDNPRPISLTLPLRSEQYTSKVLFAFFDGLIPEGWLLNITTNYWKLKPYDRFELLMAACRDTIGAVTIQPNE
ncbi:MAG: HipA N-terminal domain-containing protein [Bacteroidota bacterium]